MSRRLALLFATIVAALLLWSFRREPPPSTPTVVSASVSPPLAPASSSSPAVVTRPVNAPAPEDQITTALALNAPNGTIAADLEMLNALFTDWRLYFPRAGNPWGENVEITAALTGPNPRGLQFFPKKHSAINSAGELCDRWGTPFHFHALSGDRMEIRSAGPDKIFNTPDDAVLTPP